MVRKRRIRNGVILTVQPFSKPNLNAGCKIIARVTSSQGKRRDAEIFIGGLNNVLTLTDTAILVNALRAVADAAQKEMTAVQEAAIKARRRRN